MSDIPLYKENQEKGGYRLLQYTNGLGNRCGVYCNLSHEDETLREIFNNVNFRIALSHAIDRDEINQKLFFGMAEPAQSTALPTSVYYEPEYAEAYIEFLPERSKQLLDEMGIVDADGDGWRDVGLNVEIKMVSWNLVRERRAANKWDMGEWSIARANDLLMARQPTYFAPTWGATWHVWPAWVQYYKTGGETGMEPLPYVRPAIEAAERLAFAVDPEERVAAGKELLRLQAENLWTIGTVAKSPHPVMVSKKLKNMPEKGYFTYGFSLFCPYYPCQFYLDE